MKNTVKFVYALIMFLFPILSDSAYRWRKSYLQTI